MEGIRRMLSCILAPQGEGGAVAGAVLAVASGATPGSREGAQAPATPPARQSETPQTNRSRPVPAGQKLPALGTGNAGGAPMADWTSTCAVLGSLRAGYECNDDLILVWTLEQDGSPMRLQPIPGVHDNHYASAHRQKA